MQIYVLPIIASVLVAFIIFFFTQYLSPKHFSTILVRIHFENFLDILNHIEILNKNVKLHLLSNAFGINGNGTDKKENEDVGC